MFKTLKSKMTMICIILIMLIAVVGITSIYNITLINAEIESLMINNYKSIDAAYNMMDRIQKQNLDIDTYIFEDTQNGITSYYSHGKEFNDAYYIEKSNVTEPEEFGIVERIGELYRDYEMNFSILQEKMNTKGIKEAREFYYSDIMTNYNKIVDELSNIKKVNEEAMNKSRKNAIDDGENARYIIIIVSAMAIISGCAITNYLINKMLKPLSLLNKSIAEVREGNIGNQVPVTTKDELGDLTIEFNRMNERLQKFEKSTMGKMIKEKNKSLAIIKSIKEPIIVLDKDYRIILINQQCENFFNIQEKVAVNKYFSQVIKEENIFEAVYEVSTHQEIENKIIKIFREEEEYFFNISVNEIEDEEAKIFGYIVVLQDITQLKELDIMKGEFLSTISHEFKTSLTSIMIGTSLLESTKMGGLSEKQKKVVEAIKEDGERLNTLISELITLRKMESNKELYNFSQCNMEDIINASITTVKSLAEDKEVILEWDVEEDLPLINGDRDKLVWVMNNIISNAIKNCNKDDVIAVRGIKQERKIAVTITDTGCGMPPELTDKIFDKYVRLKNGETMPLGFGLGMSIAKEIVEGHNGEIWCTSEVGKGSIFTFVIPMEEGK
ncbi:cell wall metabolism sensor histidine kinase WalK [Clostridium cadaveris]|uniref:sensor histidine kinase n=1 Tax=Clostridium TaxID=1485 RepID=UPI001E5251E9|nr:ATP-binding protein [Clostridium cadaveris]MDU4952424.1 ATP-binding protein [Clostridium sp.]UFH65480.1 cell wall metabolism sensor histidine kinase WalK [Clostridium cadaveris]